MNWTLKRFRFMLIGIFSLMCVLTFMPISAFAETGEHAGDDFDDNLSTVVVTQKESSSETALGTIISDFFDSLNPFKEINIEDGYYRIKSAVDNNFVVDAAAAGFARGTNIQLYQNNNSDAQLWKIINQDDGYILIVNANSGLVLDITSGLAQNGTNVQSYFTNHTDAQLWKPIDAGDEKVVLVSKLNLNFVLDLSCGTAQNEQNIQLYERNDSAAQKWVFNKTEAPSLEIPALQLSLNGTTLDTINGGSKDTKYENNTLVVEEEEQATTCTEVEIKGRGNSTWQNPKKPYNIKLGKKTDLLGLGKAKKWALLANYYDPSNIRNDAAFYTARLLSSKNTWDGKYVNLYVDNEYLDLYWLTHRVEIGKSTVDLGDEGTICELDGHPPEDIFFKSAIYGSQISLKDTSVDYTKAQSALDSFEVTYNNFEKALHDKNWVEIQKYIDSDSFAYMVLLTDFVYNGDGFANSSFFYKNTFDGKIYCGPPWDFDASFFRYPYCINDPNMSICFHNGQKRVDGLLMEIPEFRLLVENKYKDLLLPNSQLIVNYMKSAVKNIYNDALKNNRKWQYPNIVEGKDYSKFEDDAEYVISSTKQHLKFLDMLYGNSVNVVDGVYNFTDKSGATLNKIKVTNQTDGYCTLIDTNTGKAICVYNAALENNAPCGYADVGSHDMYRWKFSKVGDRYYIVSKRTGLVLDTYQGLHQYDMLGSNTQLFTMQQTTFDTFDVADGTVYDIVSSLNENLDISSNSNNVRTGIGQSISSSTFKFIKNTDNTYTLQDVSSGLVVDVEANSHDNGAKIQLYKSNGSNAQKWILRKNSDGTCTFINPESWKTLDICCGQNAVGTSIQLYEINNTVAQKWTFKTSVKQSVLELAKANKGTLAVGMYKISSAINSGFVLDVAAGSKDDGANVQLYESNNTAAQQWKISEDCDGFLTIVNVGSDKALDVSGANVADGTNVWQYSGNNSYAQKWIAVKDGSAIKLVSALNPNKVLDLSAGAVANGSNIQLYSSNKTKAQRWVFETIS